MAAFVILGIGRPVHSQTDSWNSLPEFERKYLADVRRVTPAEWAAAGDDEQQSLGWEAVQRAPAREREVRADYERWTSAPSASALDEERRISAGRGIDERSFRIWLGEKLASLRPPRDPRRFHGALSPAALASAALGDPSRIGALPANFASVSDGSLARPAAEPPPVVTAQPLEPARQIPAGTIDSEALARVVHLEGGDEGEARFLAAALGKLQETREGRELLRKLIQDYSALGMTATIRLKNDPSTVVEFSQGVERLTGSIEGESDPDLGTVSINRAFMDFHDPEQGLILATTNIGHELTHLEADAHVRRALGEYRGVYGHDEVDELGARLTGWLVLLDLKPRHATDDSQDLLDFARNPRKYTREMKLTDPGYAVSFSLQEMRSPEAAMKSRLAQLNAQLEKDEKSLNEELPRRLAELQRMQELYHLEEPLRELRLMTLGDQKATANDISSLRESVDEVNKLVARWQTPDGQKELEQLRKAAADPRYERIHAEYAEREERLLKRLREQGVPRPKPTPGQYTLERFQALVRRDRIRHPEHWRDLPPLKDEKLAEKSGLDSSMAVNIRSFCVIQHLPESHGFPEIGI